ncbi:hypothetical protein [Aurantibacter aestuarii]|uniref:Selenophosphate synthetase n=1 Tax=Aurantibacter aestuarii TaxID=1266046 RepID=A0A2T1NFS5_9FLAO|nr:hypothetical protein [Aurantibacter aestuarii]PSG91642.1 hypothetical protein C7H52_00580 [Aurantibacter aestuarii]
MKLYLSLLTTMFCFLSCKQSEKQNTEPVKELTVAEKIAEAHGINHWNKVTELTFTFNVDKNSTHYDRTWIWKPKTNQVTAISKTETITYLRAEVDSLSQRADQGFINDKFWLLPAFQLVWDSGTSISEPVKVQAPISKKDLNKITLLYTGDGGYTPGDAYDIYYNDDFLIEEWIFRQKNNPEPSMTTAFGDYKTINNITFPTSSTKAEGNWKLHFTNLEVKTE